MKFDRRNKERSTWKNLDFLKRLGWTKRDFKRVTVIAAIAALIVFVSILLIGNRMRRNRFDKLVSAGESYLAAGNYRMSIQSFEQALEIESKPLVYLLISDTYVRMGDLDRAIEILYYASYHHNDDSVNQRLETLKRAQGSDGQNAGTSILFAGESIDRAEKTLTLPQRKLEDISPLSELSSLETLNLSGNEIRDISALEGLSQLSYLRLDGNDIANLTPLRSLKKLRTLYLDGNPIEDLTPLLKLSGLRTLSLRNVPLTQNQLTKLREALPECQLFADDPQIEQGNDFVIEMGGVSFNSTSVELNLSGLGLTNISSLTFCKNLKRLDLRGNSISDLTPLRELKSLEWLCIWGNKVTDLSPLSELKALTYLDADENAIITLAPISELTSLEELWISSNPSIDITVLSSLKKLQRLGLKRTNLDDAKLDIVEKLTGLRELYLDGNELLTGNRLDDLKRALPNCAVTHSPATYVYTVAGRSLRSDARVLDLSGARIADLRFLLKFNVLEELVLSDCFLGDMTPIATLSRLTTLNLNGVVFDTELVRALPGLEELHIEGCEISELSFLSSLTDLKLIYLADNPLNAEQVFDFLSVHPGCTVYTDLDMSEYINVPMPEPTYDNDEQVGDSG